MRNVKSVAIGDVSVRSPSSKHVFYSLLMEEMPSSQMETYYFHSVHGWCDSCPLTSSPDCPAGCGRSQLRSHPSLRTVDSGCNAGMAALSNNQKFDGVGCVRNVSNPSRVKALAVSRLRVSLAYRYSRVLVIRGSAAPARQLQDERIDAFSKADYSLNRGNEGLLMVNSQRACTGVSTVPSESVSKKCFPKWIFRGIGPLSK